MTSQIEQQASDLHGHLPECPTTTDPHGLDDGYACPCECQCEILRACEERVREEESRNVIGSVSLAAIGEANLQQYQLGFSEGLDAAREAVASLMPADYEMNWCAAIDAIDAVREEQK